MTKQNTNGKTRTTKPSEPTVTTREDVVRAMWQLVDIARELQRNAAALAEETGRLSGRIPDDEPRDAPPKKG